MLLEFTVSNYKSFANKAIFKMTPAPKIQDLKYSIIKDKTNNIQALSSAVIYGPNASGKTNLIGAIETLKSIVNRGHIRNEKSVGINVATGQLELIPNYKNINMPVEFDIKFFYKNLKIEYQLIIYLGNFLEKDVKRKIIKEELIINDDLIFARTDELHIGKLYNIKNYLINNFENNKKSIDDVAKSNMNDEELVLSTIFKTMYANPLVNLIQNWFEENLITRYNTNLESIPKFEENEEGKIGVDEEQNKAMKEFGFSGDLLGYGSINDDKNVIPLSIIKRGKSSTRIEAKVFESYGTYRFMNIFPWLRKALIDGGTIFIDEFDASIHPMAIMSIINVFHNDEINKKGAQLIFNTHNPIFLNRNLFRRDEIKFVEKDNEKGFSILYSLSDFGTSGDSGVRNTENYMDKYFISKYGAIKDIDFSQIFYEMMQEDRKDEDKAEE